jgi:hypothetical protein
MLLTYGMTVAAAVAIFRLATILFQAILGGLIFFFLWRVKGKDRRRKTPGGQKKPGGASRSLKAGNGQMRAAQRQINQRDY